MKLTPVFCPTINRLIRFRIMILLCSILMICGLLKVSASGADVASNVKRSNNVNNSSGEEINIVILDDHQKPVRHIKTQEELDDWTMENKCEEESAPVMFVGIPKDKAVALESRLVKDSARRAAVCIARGYREKGKLDKAVEYYSRTIDLSRTVFEAWLAHEALADIYQQQKKYQLAIQQVDWLIAHSNKEKIKNLSAIKDDLIKKEHLD